ncbi:MAG: ATP-binding protein [Lachnospiraceae bacterium]|nr:ATP-binding protein [Lachnospiraceae bacterium]
MIDEKGEKLLKYAANRVRFRKTVYDDYGFGKKLPYGRGVAIVLYGPPGTGKTMAAQVLAHELGLDIYRIDLSMISSKYIGETEKNLSKIFEAAKNSNAILFFDEADALFSKRTSVESSHDKYANAETSYLLQKIEEYDGVSVLATNNLQNFDVAFKRRMTYIIPIEAPNEQTRLRLWEKVFPPDAPIAVEVDFALLARAVELTGASIKNVALFAANLAAAEGRAIAYEDVIEAVDLECQKIGQLGMGEKLSQAVLMGI